MQKLTLTLITLLIIQTGYTQVLNHFIPAAVINSDETIISYEVEEMNSLNTGSTFKATYLQDGNPKASVKAAIYDLTDLDFDEKNYKNSLGYELVDIGMIKLNSIPFPIFEFDDQGHHKYMTQFSVLMKDHKTYEIQNYLDLKRYDNNTRQLRYIISSSDWGAIMEILSYFFHQANKAKIDVIKSSSPLERVFIDEYDFSETQGYLIVYAVGQKPEIINFNSKIWQNGNIERSKDYLVNSRGNRYLRIDDLPARKIYQKITITDENQTVILDHELKEEKEIRLPTFEDTTEDNPETQQETDNHTDNDKVVVFPSVFTDQVTVLVSSENMNSNALKTIAIINQSGEVVEVIKTYENEITMNTSFLNRGMYFIRCIHGNSSSSQIISKM